MSAAVVSMEPDATKLFVSDNTDTAKYNALPDGATVKVYSDAINSADEAAAAGAKVRITLDNEDTEWTTSDAITAGDYIFFMIFYSDGKTSSLTSDGRLPSAP